MIQCNRCNLQYIGETKRRLKDRLNEHRRTIDNPNTKSKPTSVAEHFLSSPNHTANDMQLIPIENILSYRHSIRKAFLLVLLLFPLRDNEHRKHNNDLYAFASG